MKFIVLNTKGGVGKSTLSMQILAPFLYVKNGQNDKVNLIEFYDENSDSKSFDNSNIVIAKRYKISGNDLDSTLTDISLDNDNLIVDVGGNKTTTYMLDSLKNTNLIDVFDCVFIPLTDGEQDAINAINVYNKIRDLSNDIKVIFALSRVNKSYDTQIQFLDFYGDKKGRIDDRVGYIEDIKEDDRNIIKIDDNESIKISRAFGLTVFELANQNIDDLKEKMKQYLREKNTAKSKKASYRITLINKAIQFKNDVINECFKHIDEVVD
jgi:MinD-like ATPase involved in chromosome partitioning or flagellar assembly